MVLQTTAIPSQHVESDRALGWPYRSRNHRAFRKAGLGIVAGSAYISQTRISNCLLLSIQDSFSIYLLLIEPDYKLKTCTKNFVRPFMLSNSSIFGTE